MAICTGGFSIAYGDAKYKIFDSSTIVNQSGVRKQIHSQPTTRNPTEAQAKLEK